MRRHLQSVLVQGPSMLPTLRPGDCLLVHGGARVRPGDVVVTLGAGDVTVLGPRLLSVLRAREQADG